MIAEMNMTNTEGKLPTPSSSRETSQTATDSEEYQVIDVRTLATALWRGKWFIVLCTVIGLALGIQNLINFAPQYEATMVVSPSQGGVTPTSSSRGLSGLAKSGGINQLLGGAAEATNFDRLRYTIGSKKLIQKLVEKEDIIRRIFSDSWDAELGVWIRPSGQRFEIEQRVRSYLHLRQWRPPSVESFSEFVRSAIEIKETKDAPFFRLTYRGADGIKAGQFLQSIFFEADNFLREQDKLISLKKKEYIEKQLELVTLEEHRMLLLSWLAQEGQRLMLLRIDLPYSVKIVEPVFVSSLPTSPDLVRDFGVVVVGWFLASIGIAIVFFLLKSD